jgi:hypothetical protein
MCCWSRSVFVSPFSVHRLHQPKWWCGCVRVPGGWDGRRGGRSTLGLIVGLASLVLLILCVVAFLARMRRRSTQQRRSNQLPTSLRPQRGDDTPYRRGSARQSRGGSRARSQHYRAIPPDSSGYASTDSHSATDSNSAWSLGGYADGGRLIKAAGSSYDSAGGARSPQYRAVPVGSPSISPRSPRTAGYVSLNPVPPPPRRPVPSPPPPRSASSASLGNSHYSSLSVHSGGGRAQSSLLTTDMGGVMM